MCLSPPTPLPVSIYGAVLGATVLPLFLFSGGADDVLGGSSCAGPLIDGVGRIMEGFVLWIAQTEKGRLEELVRNPSRLGGWRQRGRSWFGIRQGSKLARVDGHRRD